MGVIADCDYITYYNLKMLLDELGLKIKKCREERGLKQADIANALQVSSQAVSKWERGENAPDILLLPQIAKLLDVSIDWLLGLYDEGADVFNATVFVSSVKGYAKKSQETAPRELALWANAFFYQLTEAITKNNGVPIKQIGDGLLCFFSGPKHRERAVKAALSARAVTGESITVALAAGEIFLGGIGHPNYEQIDIIGDPVNIAFRALEFASSSDGGIIATAEVVETLKEKVKTIGPKIEKLTFIPEPVSLYEISDK